jgi:polysaccharide biosynthesis/export protein
MIGARTILRALALATVLALGACANEPRLGEGDPSIALAVTPMPQDKDLPPPGEDDMIAAARPYHIGPLDKIEVKILNFPDLGGEFQTDVAGRLVMPLIGEVEAAGHTPIELATGIRAKLVAYLQNPQVTVNLQEANGQNYTIDGQVTQPGSYAVTGDMTLMRAVAGAKGLNDYARMDDVVVFRTVGGKPLAALYNMDAIRHGYYADPKIYANDKIVVGDSKARRMFQQFLQVAPLLTTPLILALERIN